MARVVAVSSAKNQARSGKHLPAAASSCVDPQTAQRTHVSSTHTRTFAGTHLKTRRIVRLCIITLCTAASRRISAHPRPPTRPIGRPLQPFFSKPFGPWFLSLYRWEFRLTLKIIAKTLREVVNRVKFGHQHTRRRSGGEVKSHVVMIGRGRRLVLYLCCVVSEPLKWSICKPLSVKETYKLKVRKRSEGP